MAFLHTAAPHQSGPRSGIRSRSMTPYLLLLPGMLWLITFFIIPIFSLASTSTMVRPQGAQLGQYVQQFRFQNYIDAFQASQAQYLRSFVYAGIATLLALAIAYPLAYMIAFKSGRFRNILLVMVVAPFFTSFLLLSQRLFCVSPLLLAISFLLIFIVRFLHVLTFLLGVDFPFPEVLINV